MDGRAIGVKRPRGLLIDYGGTLVEEVAFDARAGHAWLLAHADVHPGVTLDMVIARATRVSAQLSERRHELGVEAPWPSITRLVYDYFGIRFVLPAQELEVGFWDASMTTRPIPGAREALDAFHVDGVAMAVVSNAMFGPGVIRHEIAKYGLADHLAFVTVSAEYVVRKPNALLFEVAAARLGLSPSEIWVVGDRVDTDVRGAQAAGMTAVWLRPPNAADSDEPDITVGGWVELRRCFEETRPE
jgi:HAD superfamily hydrolase (TIGR01509 family)